jgi:hypothetical protein
MYRLQRRIASASQAARCFGVHCCAAAGKDANVSARPKAAERRVIARRFSRAVQILILEPLPSAPVFTVNGSAMATDRACDCDLSWQSPSQWSEGRRPHEIFEARSCALVFPELPKAFSNWPEGARRSGSPSASSDAMNNDAEDDRLPGSRCRTVANYLFRSDTSRNRRRPARWPRSMAKEAASRSP